MRSDWRDGERDRVVELRALGPMHYEAVVDGVAFELTLEPLGNGRWRLESGGDSHLVEISAEGARHFVRLDRMDFVLARERGVTRRTRGPGAGSLESPMPGVITRVMAKPGERVSAGQPLLAIEAMKMEHLIRAPHAGTVRSIAGIVGEMVSTGVPLAELDVAEVPNS